MVESHDGIEIKKYLKNTILPIFINYHTKIINENKQLQNDYNVMQNQLKIMQNQESLMSMDGNAINTLNKSLKANDNTLFNNTLKQSVNEDLIKVANRFVVYLENSTNRNTLVKELGTEFYDPNFYSELDCNPNVFHCSNGVYDLAECLI